MRLLVDERSRDDRLLRVELTCEAEAVVMYVDGARVGELPAEIVVGAMRRLGQPLEDDVRVPDGGLHLAEGARLTMMRFLARYDVIARDWMVLVTPTERLGAFAVTATAALEHLVTAYRNTVTQES